MPAVDLISDPEQRGGVSRRTFIKGVIATGATVSSAAYLFRSSGVFAEAPAQGAVERLITLNVNGQQRRVDVVPHETLEMTLRYKLGLTGTKLACDRTECGKALRHNDYKLPLIRNLVRRALRGRPA